tara:strand:+ start:217 stop:498 length:282 start_codon:yes stop_codon:yes gene_type:complete
MAVAAVAAAPSAWQSYSYYKKTTKKDKRGEGGEGVLCANLKVRILQATLVDSGVDAYVKVSVGKSARKTRAVSVNNGDVVTKVSLFIELLFLQ